MSIKLGNLNVKTWNEVQAEHAEYARDAHLAAADKARCRYRRTGLHQDFREWKGNIATAWRMRAILKTNKVLFPAEPARPCLKGFDNAPVACLCERCQGS